jgi:F0F1-type ATP synthase delta subunit
MRLYSTLIIEHGEKSRVIKHEQDVKKIISYYPDFIFYLEKNCEKSTLFFEFFGFIIHGKITSFYPLSEKQIEKLKKTL